MARFTVTCPHCHAQIEIDDSTQVVASSRPVEKPKSSGSLEDRLEALARERESARDKMAEAFRAEQAGSELREERFKKLLQEAKDSPVEKPVRDIDLD